MNKLVFLAFLMLFFTHLSAQSECAFLDSVLKNTFDIEEELNKGLYNEPSKIDNIDKNLRKIITKRLSYGFGGKEYTTTEKYIATLMDINYTYQCDSVIPILKLYRDYILSDIQSFEYDRMKESGVNVDSLYETKIAVENVKVEINDPIVSKFIRKLHKKGYKTSEIAIFMNKPEDEIIKMIKNTKNNAN